MFTSRTGSHAIIDLLEQLSPNAVRLPPPPEHSDSKQLPSGTGKSGQASLLNSRDLVYVFQEGDIDRAGVAKEKLPNKPDAKANEALKKAPEQVVKEVPKGVAKEVPKAAPQPDPERALLAQRTRGALAASRAEDLYDCFIGTTFMHLIPDAARAVTIIKRAHDDESFDELKAAFTEVCKARNFTRTGSDNLETFLQVYLPPRELREYLRITHSQEAVDDAHRLSRARPGAISGAESLLACVRDISGYDEDTGTITRDGAFRLIRARVAFDAGYQHKEEEMWGFSVISRTLNQTIASNKNATSIRSIFALAQATVARR